ncbi:MAG: hypothetical protein HY235_00420 [Acidobacteria bacterium]|nr:hypothetical protein [Acidobacteriota bacterium]
MTCREFILMARDYGRDEWMSVDERRAAASHLESCGGCRRRLEQERALSSGLAAWACRRREVAAPAAVETAVVAAFRGRKQKFLKRWPAWAAVPIAAAALLIAVLLWRSDKPQPAAPVEMVTEFVPLRYGKPLEPGEPIQLIRIQVPQAELLRLGMPVAPDSGARLVKADVVLGEDGLAKAIRFVY